MIMCLLKRENIYFLDWKFRKKHIFFEVDFPFHDEWMMTDRETTRFVDELTRKLELLMMKNHSILMDSFNSHEALTMEHQKKFIRSSSNPAIIMQVSEDRSPLEDRDHPHLEMEMKEQDSNGWKNQFSKYSVYKWSRTQIKTWINRHKNYNAFYYRFTGKKIDLFEISRLDKVACFEYGLISSFYSPSEPGAYQSLREFTSEEEELFMSRYLQFKEHNWHVGSAWGLFSLTLPHRVGYQCSNYYRKLLREGKLYDLSYGWDEEGNFRQLYKDPDIIHETCIQEVRTETQNYTLFLHILYYKMMIE
jgi:predicted RNA-binding protein associated with RNAse of E/G family